MENLKRGRAALDRVLSERRDEPFAMHRKELGWIEFRWGNVEIGIRHLIERRNTADGIDGEAFARLLPDAIAYGRLNAPYVEKGQLRGTITWSGRTVVLELVAENGRTAWIATAFPGMKAMPKSGRLVSRAEADQIVADAVARGISAPRKATQAHPTATGADLGAAVGNSIGPSPVDRKDTDDGKFSLRPGEPDPTDPRQPGSAEARKGLMLRLLESQPIEWAVRAPFDIFGGTDGTKSWNPGKHLTSSAVRIITSDKPDNAGMFGWMNLMLHTARAGLVDRYGYNPAYKERNRQRKMDENRMMREAQVCYARWPTRTCCCRRWRPCMGC